MTRGTRWLAVAGARPNFVKLGPLVAAARRAGASLPWVHTGQHWDVALSAEIVSDVGLPPPVAHLGVGEGTASVQTARILSRLPGILARRRPDVVVVLGDVTSTLAAALAAVQSAIPVAHVEAGLRSFDESMPEERNRILVDHVSARLYVTEPSGVDNLAREGVPAGRLKLVGNTMLDSLLRARGAMKRIARVSERAGAVVTLHRPSNVDEPRRLRAWAAALALVARLLPVTFPVHPRTRARLAALGLDRRLISGGVRVTRAARYREFVRDLATARVVLTDSGGIQEEAVFLGTPCLTLRTTTERPQTLLGGRNRLVGDDPARLVTEVERTLARPLPRPLSGRLVDGHAADRIVADLLRFR